MTRTRKMHAPGVIGYLFGILMALIGLTAWAQTRDRALDARPSGSGPLLFMPVVDYNSGGFGAGSVAVADVNGDGKPDLIVANACTDGYCQGSSVGVLLGNGDGTFGAVVTYESGGNKTYSVAVADVNRDGKPDLVLTNACSGSNCLPPATVGVLLGNGDGTFGPAANYNSAGESNALAVADVNRDGKPDLVVVGDKVAVLLHCRPNWTGNGSGDVENKAMNLSCRASSSSGCVTRTAQRRIMNHAMLSELGRYFGGGCMT